MREGLAEIGVRRQAVAAAVDLGDRERDPLAGRGGERALAERAVQGEVAFERGGAVETAGTCSAPSRAASSRPRAADATLRGRPRCGGCGDAGHELLLWDGEPVARLTLKVADPDRKR